MTRIHLFLLHFDPHKVDKSSLRLEQEAAGRPSSATKSTPAAQGKRGRAAIIDGEGRDTRAHRPPSQAAAVRGDDSSCPPLSTTTEGDIDGGSKVDERRGVKVGKEGDGETAGVGIAGSGGGLDSESQWTAGTVTSRG